MASQAIDTDSLLLEEARGAISSAILSSIRQAYRSFYRDENLANSHITSISSVDLGTRIRSGIEITITAPASNHGWFIGKDGLAVKHVAEFLEHALRVYPIKVFIRAPASAS